MYTAHSTHSTPTCTYLDETLGIDRLQIEVLTITSCLGTRVNTHTHTHRQTVPTLVEVDQMIVQGLGAAITGGGGQGTKGKWGNL